MNTYCFEVRVTTDMTEEEVRESLRERLTPEWMPVTDKTKEIISIEVK